MPSNEPGAEGCFARPRSVSDAVEALARAAGYALTDYQRAYLSDPSPMRAVLKARQTGFSWLFALEALAGALAERRFSIFVSLNREEAAEKVLYAREMRAALPEGARPRAERSGEHEVRLVGGGRLLSFPCRAPRGKAKASLYLDELAFYPNAERVYDGALPVTSHGGRVTLASTPCGDRGLFWRLVCRPGAGEAYSVHRVPWWQAPWFCRAPRLAAEAVESMETEERVRRFATPVLQRLFGAMERDAFRQEYELAFLESREALIPWEEVERAAEDIALCPDWEGLAATGARLTAGLDIGRRHDPTEIVVVAAEVDALRVRALRSLRHAPFHDQEHAAAEMMARAPVALLCVDATGMGGPVAENLARTFPGRVLPVTFTAPRKEEMAARLRLFLQSGRLRIPRHRALMEQIHAVRRGFSGGGRMTLDAPREVGHHADMFWALALALHGAADRAGGVSVRPLRA